MEKLTTNATTREIARKVNEIVAWINNEEHADEVMALCQKSITEESSTVEYPDFRKWTADAIVTQVLDSTKAVTAYTDENDGLRFAPEDFYIEEDGERQYLFTWDEAMKLEEEVLKPNGWRLPTCEELVQLCATYIDDEGGDDAERFMKELNVEKCGWKGIDGTVGGVGSNGGWWSSTAYSSTSARYLGFDSGDFYPQTNSSKGNGFAVRCVAQ